MENEQIVIKIKEWCFAQELKNYSDHSLFQTQLVNLLKENGWFAYKEYDLGSYSSLSVRTGLINDRRGLIDICAFAYNKKLMLEYDKSTQLRTKSINKLFCSNADLLIGIVRGKHGKPFLRFENTSKIARIAKELSISNKAIFLIVIENRLAEWVHV